jgi:hypothetical protein
MLRVKESVVVVQGPGNWKVVVVKKNDRSQRFGPRATSITQANRVLVEAISRKLNAAVKPSGGNAVISIRQLIERGAGKLEIQSQDSIAESPTAAFRLAHTQSDTHARLGNAEAARGRDACGRFGETAPQHEWLLEFQ